MADDIIAADDAAAKLARRKAQKREATARFLARQKAAGIRYHAEHYAKHRDKRLAARRAYYAANRDAEVRKAAAYRLADPAKAAEVQDRFRRKHRHRLAVNIKARRKANHQHTREIEKRSQIKHRVKRLAESKAHRRANLVLYRAAQSRIRAQRRSAPGRYSPTDVAQLFGAQRGKCAYCRKSIKRLYHVDHITPLSNGGTNWPKNLQLTCPSCNMQKHAKDPIAFAQELGRLL